jgi:hypothetical protein
MAMATNEKWEIQTFTICDGWTNPSEEPEFFGSKEEAEADLDDFLKDCNEAGMDGYTRDEWRVARVGDRTDNNDAFTVIITVEED